MRRFGTLTIASVLGCSGSTLPAEEPSAATPVFSTRGAASEQGNKVREVSHRYILGSTNQIRAEAAAQTKFHNATFEVKRTFFEYLLNRPRACGDQLDEVFRNAVGDHFGVTVAASDVRPERVLTSSGLLPEYESTWIELKYRYSDGGWAELDIEVWRRSGSDRERAAWAFSPRDAAWYLRVSARLLQVARCER